VDNIVRGHAEVLVGGNRQGRESPNVHINRRQLPDGDVHHRQASHIQLLDPQRLNIPHIVDLQRFEDNRVYIVYFLEMNGNRGNALDSLDRPHGPDRSYRSYRIKGMYSVYRAAVVMDVAHVLPSFAKTGNTWSLSRPSRLYGKPGQS